MKRNTALKISLFAVACISCLLLGHTVYAAAHHHHRHVRHSRKVAAAPKPPPPPAWQADHDQAVQLARQGMYDQALPILYDLYNKHPDDVSVVRDYLAVLDWKGGYDGQVVSLYQSLHNPDQPDYVLEAVGHAYRDLHQPANAYAVYRFGLVRSLDSAPFAAGVIRSLADDGYVENALAYADANLLRYGNRIEVLLAAGYSADQYGQADKALRYYQTAVQMEPQNTEALQGLIRAEDRTGSPGAALQLADAHPGIIPAADYRRIEGDDAAEMVRLAVTAAPDPEHPYDLVDRAIARLNILIAEWAQQGPEAQPNIDRARFDRILALHARFLMQAVVDDYNSLLAEGVKVPGYDLGAVADAYLYLHEPEKARDLSLEALKTDPTNYELRRGLFYAYIDSDDYENAFKVADAMASEQPAMTYQSWQSQPEPNPKHASAEFLAGEARIYAGEIEEADRLIVPAAQTLPNDPYAREVMGNLYMAHGWPRRALQEYKTGLSLGSANAVNNEIGVAAADLDLQYFKAAETGTQKLVQQAPDNPGVQRADRAWQIHNMAELDVRAGYQFQPETENNVIGGEGYGIDTRLYSSPVDYYWRIFADEYFSHQREPNQEGNISFSQSAVGLEYRNGPLTASAEPTYNHYHGSERMGGEADASWSFNDQWTVAGSGALFSRDTPLRAMNSGVTASAINAHAVWQPDEAHSLRFGGDIMPFSDGNLRSGVDADYTQRLYTIPDFYVNGLADAGESQNSLDENRLYYNPGADFIALAGAQAVQTLYQRYTTLYQHSLQITPGMYWQLNHGESAALRMRYEQRVFLSDAFQAGVGVNFSRQSYDGSPENDIGLSLDLTERF